MNLKRIVAMASMVPVLLVSAPAAQAAPPTVTNTTFSAVTTTAVTLRGTINPEEKPTAYHFEYGPTDCGSGPCTSVPVPEGELDKGNLPVAVSTRLEGLTPHTTYHFRLVARNFGSKESGETKGPDRAFTTFAPQPPFPPCPNDALRAGAPSTALPDCRAYEQASPVDKNGLDATGTVPFVKATPSGDRISFGAANGFPGAEGGQELPVYLATRGPAGWSTQGLLPSASLAQEAHVSGWLPDFSQVFGESHTTESFANGSLYARSSADGSLFPLVPFGDHSGGRYIASTPDGTLVFFYSDGALPGKPGLAGQQNIYVWNRESNEITLASVLPGGEPAAGNPQVGSALAGTPYTYNEDNHVVSEDGSIYFTDRKTGQLYLRNDAAGPDPQTILVSGSKRTPPDPLGRRDADFQAATPDGSHAFFASPEELTNDANTGPVQPPPVVGRADVSSDPPASEPDLPITAAGIATDSQYVYWVNPRQDAIGRATLDGKGSNATFIPIPPRIECPPDLPSGKPDCAPAEQVAVAAHPRYLAVDSGHIYWTNERSRYVGTGTIGRADVLGTPANVEPEWIKGATRPRGIAADADHVYWANAGDGSSGSGSIGRASIDKSAVSQTFIPAETTESPEGVAVDATHIYWTENDPNGSLGGLRRNDIADGANRVEKVIGKELALGGIAVHAEHVYWASRAKEAIGRAALDFGEPIAQFLKTGGKPLSVSSISGHLYWSVNGEISPNPGNDLYRFDVADEALTDLTPDAGDPNGAEIQGLLGTSDDGSYVYFAANGDLDGGGPASAGDCRSAGGISEAPLFKGHCSLYLSHNGAITLIAALDATGDPYTSDAVDWQTHGGVQALGPGQIEKSSRVSPDGQTLIFRSREQLDAYDNEGRPELYRYVNGQGPPRCISCPPSGVPPSGGELRGITVGTIKPEQPNYVLHRTLSADGERVFFQSNDALLPVDTNGEDGCSDASCQDVYEWEAQGSGSCAEEVIGGGCLYLLSGGKSINASYLGDASLNGDHAFLFTTDQLVGQDRDKLYDLYDATAEGGLASQDGFVPPICETPEACHPGPTEPRPFTSPASAQFSGPESPKPSRRKPHKPHKKHHAKKKHRKHSHKHSKAGRARS